jgi:hypothetical protein
MNGGIVFGAREFTAYGLNWYGVKIVCKTWAFNRKRFGMVSW